MSTYVLRRLILAVPLLLFISLICFGLMNLAPGGPLAHLEGNPNIRPEDIAIKRALLHLDEPWPVRYVHWLGGILRHGDFGRSFATNEPVLSMIAGRLPATLELMLTAFAVSLVLGLSLGILAALRRAGPVDYAATLFAFIGISLPVFWLGLMAQLIFGVHLGWFPVEGPPQPGAGLGAHVRHLALPVSCLSLLYLASWSRYARSSLLEVLSLDYVRTARAKGLPRRRVVLVHALRNALVPVVTVVALQVPTLFTGAIITETIFAWPGMGLLFYQGVEKADYPRLMAILVISSTLIVLFNLIADILHGLLDPRVSFR